MHTLFHIYGPFAIHSFGLMLAIGVLITVYCAVRDPLRARLMSPQAFYDAIALAVIAGIIGSRLLFVMQNWHEFVSWTDALNIWEGGFSVLGSVVGILAVMPWYLVRHQVFLFSFFDLIALYAPLLQAIARVGCFFAGCCWGVPTQGSWAIMYVESESYAPLCVPLHPTQLYSAALLLSIFAGMHWCVRVRYVVPGQLFAIYLFLMSIERFVIDFFRGDREFFENHAMQALSVHQWIALGIAGGACVLYVYVSYMKRNDSAARL